MKQGALTIAAAAWLCVSCQSNDDGGAAGAAAGSSGAGAGGAGGTGTSGVGAGDTGAGGAGATNGAAGGPQSECPSACALSPASSCSAPQVRVTEVELGRVVLNNDSEAELMPLMLAAIPSGGSRLAFMSDDGAVHVAELDCDDRLVGTPFSLPAHDFQDIAADATGGVIVLTRDAKGGGTLNCGEPSNLCDGGPEEPIPCYDMLMVRYDCAGQQRWSTLLTTASADLPPYSTGPEGPTAYMVWWYQHHGRIAYDGTNYAAYFCDAVSVSEDGCINIHQADRMQVVAPGGELLSDHDDAFALGCSHSGFTRIVWDPAAGRFVMVCKTDNANRIAQPAPTRTVYPVDLPSSSVGDLALASGGGYWLTASSLGVVHLLRFGEGEAEQDIVLADGDHPHLAPYGADLLLAGWDSGGSLVAEVLDAAEGSQVSSEVSLDVPGNRYHSFEAFPDGSVAYAAPGTSPTSVRIARVLPCAD